MFLKKEMFKEKDINQDFKDIPLKTFSINRRGNYRIQDLKYFISSRCFFDYLARFRDLEDEFLYYRGTGGDHYNLDIDAIIKGDAHQLKKYFVVGEKGSSFRLEIPRASGDNENDNLNNKIKEKIDFMKTINKNFNPELLPESLEGKIEVLNALIHVLGREYDDKRKEESYFISAAIGEDKFEIAKEFAERNGRGMVILGFGELDDNIFDSERLREFNMIDEATLRDEQEVLVKDVMFPNRIIGLFVFDEEDIFFVVNPWLVEKLKKIRDFENGEIKIKYKKLFKILLYSSNIPINQDSFESDNISLGNNGKVYEKNRRIIKNH